jgi:hypothetical protein
MPTRHLRRLTALLAAVVLVGCGDAQAPRPTPSPTAPSPTPDVGPSGTIRVSGAAPVALATRFGQNYWCWSNYGNQVAGTEGLVSQLGLRLLRAGGHNNDSNTSSGFDPFDEAQIDRFVAYARSVGAEPILQVPLLKNDRGGPATAQDAADMVGYCNRTKGYAIRYWEIGNEPDLYADQGDVPGYDVTRFCNDFNAYSDAMKRVDRSIQVLGPELSWKYYPQSGANDWLSPFLTRCRGRYDVVAVHRYPFDANGATIASAMGDVAGFNSVVRAMRTRMASLGVGDVPLAITEANVSWDGDPAHSAQSASPQTFYAGLWVADSLAAAIRQRLWAMCYWSLSEGWTLGFLDPTSHQPRPSYYAFQLIARHTGPTLLAATPPAGFSAYASRSADGRATLVVVINKNATTNHESIVIADLKTAAGGSYEYDFPPYSLSVLSIPDDARPMTVWMYTKAMADAGSPPQQMP